MASNNDDHVASSNSGSHDLARKRKADFIESSTPSRTKRLCGTAKQHPIGFGSTAQQQQSDGILHTGKSHTGPHRPNSSKFARQQLSFLPDFKVVVCLPCGHCIVPPPRAKQHLKRMHPHWAPQVRNDLERYISELCLVAPEHVSYPPRHAPAVTELPVYDGWSCRLYEYLCVSELSMQKHAKDSCGWLKGYGRQ